MCQVPMILDAEEGGREGGREEGGGKKKEAKKRGLDKNLNGRHHIVGQD